MFKMILNAFERLFSLSEAENAMNDFQRELEWKKNKVRLMIQGRIL